jgi:hypothetical protein
MSNLYDSYVWRLVCTAPAVDIRLPRDLEWVDEISWTPISQNVKTTLTGALVIQESIQKKGRPITLTGKDDMAWIKRTLGDSLVSLKNTIGCIMTLQYLHWNGVFYSNVLHEYTVMFRHYDPPPLELENVLRFDNFEPDSWYKVRNIKFMEATSGTTSPCSANVTLTITGVSGTFKIGDLVTGGTSNATGVVMGFSGTTLKLFVDTGLFESGEAITGANGSATVV